MRKIELSLFALLIMLLLVPVHSVLAVSASSPLYTHFVYMLGHANYLHWAVNAISILCLIPLYTARRMIIAYTASVLLSFIPSSLIPHPESIPIVGASVIVCFFVGFMSVWLWKCRRLTFWQLVLFTVITVFIPNVATGYHIAMFIVGLIANRIEYLINDFKNFISR